MQRRARTPLRVIPIVLALFAGLSVVVLGVASDHASAAVTKTVTSSNSVTRLPQSR